MSTGNLFQKAWEAEQLLSCTLTAAITVVMSVCQSVLMATFPGEPGFTGAKDDRSGGDNCSYKTCKATVKLSPPTNQHRMFYRPNALPVARPPVSEHRRVNSSYVQRTIIDLTTKIWNIHMKETYTEAAGLN